MTTNTGVLLTNLWVTNTFAISNNAPTWDRHFMSDSNYINGKLATNNHPYLWINATNKSDMAQWYQTNNPSRWTSITNFAQTAMNQPWWGTPNNSWGNVSFTNAGSSLATNGSFAWVPAQSWYSNSTSLAALTFNGSAWVMKTNGVTLYSLNASSPYGTYTAVSGASPAPTSFISPLSDEDDRGTYITSVAFAWMMTGDGHWTNGLIQTYSNLVQYHQAAYRWQYDYSVNNGEGMLHGIVYGYDWLYSMLPNQVRTNAIGALRKIARASLYNVFWFTPTNHATSLAWGGSDSTGEFVGPYMVESGSAAKFSASHPRIYSQVTWFASLAIWADDPDAREMVDMYLNYMIGRASPYGHEALNRGRAYAFNETFRAGLANHTLLLQTIFPEMKFTNDPDTKVLSDWWMREMPPGFVNTSEPWGIYTPYNSRDWWRRPNIGYELAYATGNGDIVTAIRQSEAIYGPYTSGDPSWDAWVASYYYKLPPQTTNNVLAAVYPTSGFVNGSTLSPNLSSSFTNGVSFAFGARPMGSEMDHTRLNDLDLEINSYGATVSANQSGSGYAATPTYMANTCLINGTNQVETAWGPRVPIYGSIIAFTNGPDFTYCAGDATPCFPKSLFPNPDPHGGNNNPTGFFLPIAGVNYSMPYVSKVQRHVIFMRRKYFVLYDDLATTNNATFQWIWHTLGSNVLTDAGGSFDYTVHPVAQELTYPWQSVSVHVFQCVNSNSIAATNRYGTNVYINPYMAMDLSAWATYEAYPMTNAMWLSNVTPTNHQHFMEVIFPDKPGDAPPIFTRLNDYAVRVIQGTNDDTITVNPATSPIQFTLDMNLYQKIPSVGKAVSKRVRIGR